MNVIEAWFHQVLYTKHPFPCFESHLLSVTRGDDGGGER